MSNTEAIKDKAAEALTRELETLTDQGLHQFFIFFYRLNHTQANMIEIDKFEEFLESFEDNPFKVNEHNDFRHQLIENIIKYAFDYMSLITAAVLIKKDFTIEEITQYYYANIDIYENQWY